MSTGNHLTVRDYFDQVHFGRTLNGNVYSAQSAGTSSGKTFHQLLASRENQQLIHNEYKTTGLTVTDYLSNPVRVKCHYNYRIESPSAGNKNSDTGKAPLSLAKLPPQDSRDGSTERFHVKSSPLTASESSSAPPAHPDSNESIMIEKSIHQAARKYNLPAGLLWGVIRAESNFQVKAVSQAGAQGLMQLMPGTAEELGVDNPFDIDQNIDGGARYLRKMLDSFGGDIKVALAAYNAGPGTVNKYGGQIPPFQETEQYIDRVLRYFRKTA